MGMRTYAVSDYGLHVTMADVEVYAEANDLDAFDFLTEVGNYYSDIEGECFVIMKEDEIFTCDESFAILSLEKFPTLFGQAYENIGAAISELKENYAEYLPIDFDYKGKLVRLVGTLCG